jgi:hypothetical protein
VRFLLLLAALAPAAAHAGNPWEEIMGRKPRLWTDPEARFSVDLPVGWTGTVRESAPTVVDFWKTHPDSGFVAHVTVEMRRLPPGVAVRHFNLQITSDVKRGTLSYRLVGERAIQVSGVKAIRTDFTHREQGNAQLVNEVTQVVLIMGERAFIIMMENAVGTREVFGEDFEIMLVGFSGRSPGEEIRPGAKKKVRSGEMVNPDAVPY